VSSKRRQLDIAADGLARFIDPEAAKGRSEDDCFSASLNTGKATFATSIHAGQRSDFTVGDRERASDD